MAGKKGMRSLLPVVMPPRYDRGFAWTLDQRSRLGRDLQATLAGLTSHLGGAQAVSLPQLYLCERLAFVERRLRDHESAVLSGSVPLMTEGEYVAYVGQLSGLCKSLGLSRRARPVASLREVIDGSAA